MSKDRTYRAGVIGIGKRGLQLSRICSQLPNAEIVAAADMNPEHLERAVEVLGKISCYDHHRALLDNEDLDFIIIGTWGLERRVPTVDAANAGIKGLFIEKPMATSLADCDAMIEACRRNGTVLTVGHQHRWWPDYHLIRDRLRDGAIGKVTHGYFYWSNGRVGSFGTHMFDLLNIVVDSEVEWVSGRLDPTSRPWAQWPDILDPAAMGFIVYRNGVRIALDAMEDVHQSIDILLFGTTGRLHILEDGARVRHWLRSDGSLDYEQPLAEHPFELPDQPENRHDAGTLAGLAELIECMETGRESSSTGTHGRQALEIIAAIHLSNRQDMRVVRLPLTGKDVEMDLKFR